jgi:hypothetical protein
MTCFRHHGMVLLLETANAHWVCQVDSPSEYPKAEDETMHYRK